MNLIFDLANLYLQRRSINLLSSCDYIAPFVSYLLNGFVHWKYESINKIYTWKESSGFKKFPGQILPGFRFSPKMVIFCSFPNQTFLLQLKHVLKCNFWFPDVQIRFFCQKSGFLKTSFLKSMHAKNFFGEIFLVKIRF